MLRRRSRAIERSAPSVSITDTVRTIKAVGDCIRLQILRVLLKSELSVTALTKELGMAQPRVSHHLTILRNSSLVRARRSGKQIFYSVNPDFRISGGPRGSASIQLDCLRVQFPESSGPS